MLTYDNLPRDARRLLLDAALKMTNLEGKMRKAVRLVILDGMKPAHAAKRVSRNRANVARALSKVRPKLEEVAGYAIAKAAQ